MYSRKKVRSNNLQLRMLVDYMLLHKEFANGEYRGPMGSRKAYQEWEALRKLLKQHGPDKNIEQWRHMVRHYKRKKEKTYSENQIQKALDDVRKNKMTTYAAAAYYQIPRSTLNTRLTCIRDTPGKPTTWRDLKRKARDEGARIINQAQDPASNSAQIRLSEISKKILRIIGKEGALENVEENGTGSFLAQPQQAPSSSSTITPPQPCSSTNICEINEKPQSREKIRTPNFTQATLFNTCTEPIKSNSSSSLSNLSEYEALGINVARKLEKMDQLQAIYAESLINSILRYGLLKKLNAGSDICNGACGNVGHPPASFSNDSTDTVYVASPSSNEMSQETLHETMKTEIDPIHI